MKKSLRNLAQVAAGLGAAYALTKMGKTEPSEADSLRMQNQAEQEDASRAAFAKKNARISDAQRMANQAAQEDASRAAFAQANKPRDTFASDTLERGSVAAFKQDEANRQARIAAQRLPTGDRRKALAEFDEKARAYNLSMKGAKKGKMIKAAHGGAVVARGNKLARSKPTKLF